MHTAIESRCRIVVVDRHGDSYAHLRGASRRGGTVCKPCSVWPDIHLLRSGAEALKHRPRQTALWLIHIDLPDMSGLDLCQQLRARYVDTPVCVIDESHHPRRERAAYRIGATLYTCKPITAEWLAHWLPEMAPA